MLQAYDNLFSANHRFHMVDKHNYTQAQTVSVGTLAEYYEQEIKPIEERMNYRPEAEDHDCHASEEDGCKGYEIIKEVLNS